ncbi:RHS repeat-associated core domain-containing protein [Pseudomonas sp. NPDC087346]|uniref:RHS repeat-associated core domain-containing protein n=1 Tax=Pseudomonas sp. NPDC087346 TaxID=3364438 RepID=UPI0037FA1962
MKVYSEAYNNPDISSPVNTRTGGVDLSYPLARISSGLQFPAAFTLCVQSKAGVVDTDDPYSVGSNWSFNVPRLELASGLCRLSNGSVQKINTTTLALEYHKLHDISIEKVRNNDPKFYSTYLVKHKSGIIEYLNAQGQITKLVSASGHYLDFIYETSYGDPLGSLTEITDGQGSSISITYPSRSYTGANSSVISVTEKTLTSVKVTYLYSSRVTRQLWKLDSITMPNDVNARLWFEYTSIDGQAWVTKVTAPNGQVQKFTYRPIKSSPSDTVQVVSKVELCGEYQEQSGQKISIEYEYSDKNFTGYLPGAPQQSNTDNCLLRDDTYTYTVTEKHADIQYVRTFNRFHLMVSEVFKKAIGSGPTTTVQLGYPLVAGGLSAQPSNYSLWTTSTTMFAEPGGRSRVVTETRSFDNDGNLLTQRSGAGVTVTNGYYPSSGESANCPADPNGFVNYLKLSSTKPNDAAANASVKTAEWKYASIIGLRYPVPTGGTRTASMVQAKEYKQNGVVIKTCTYISANTTPAQHPLFVGMLASEVSGSSHTLNFTYANEEGMASIQTQRVAGALTTTSTKKISPNTGLVYQDIAENGEKTEYFYDSLDRVIQKIKSPKKSTEQIERYTYEHYKLIDSTYKCQNTVTIKTSNGVEYINYINHFGLLSYSLEKISENAPAFRVHSITYNAAGLVQEDIEHDSVLSYDGKPRATENKTQYVYDMRQLSEIQWTNGTKQIFTTSLASNTKTSRYQSGPTYTIVYNDFGLPVSLKIRVDQEEKVLEQNTYDGFGRNIQVTTFAGGRKTTGYDLFDRVVTQSIKGKLDSEQEDTTSYEYASAVSNMYSPISLYSITRKGADEREILEALRDYDGFGRLIEQDSQVFVFDQPFDLLPSNSTYINRRDYSVTNSWNAITLKVDAVTVKSGTHPETTFRYNHDLTTGQLTSASTQSKTVSVRPNPPGTNVTPTCELQYAYDNRGLPTRIVGTYAGGVSTQLTKTYSSSGQRLTRAVNHMGITEDYNYDSSGRLIAIGYPGVATLSLSYNADGGIFAIDVSSAKFSHTDRTADNLLATVEFEYNRLGLESGRRTKVAIGSGDSEMLNVINQFNEDSVLTSRSVRRGHAAPMQTTTYAYQAQYGELKSATTSGEKGAKSVVTYNHAGGNRLSTVTETNKPVETYTYSWDTLSTFEPRSQGKSVPLDFMGNITHDMGTRGLRYDAANRISAVTVDQGREDYLYSYDPAGRLCQISKGSERVTYVYDGDTLIGEISGTIQTLYLRVGEVVIGRYVKQGTEEKFELYATDSTGSVRGVKSFSTGEAGTNETSSVYYDYTDYGVRTADRSSQIPKPSNLIERNTLGFNGCLFDDISGTYLLGNGYRAYSPFLRTFYSRDNLSPFGGAGINRYQYCQLDPINNVDPSGHLSTSAQWGIGLGVASILLSAIPVVGVLAGGALLSVAGGLTVAGALVGVTSGALGIASSATEDNEELSRNLGYASLAFGVAAFGLSLGANAARAYGNFAIRAQQVSKAQESARTLGGTAYGPLEHISKIGKTEKIIAEGAPFVTQGASGWLDDGGQLANRLRPILQGNGPVNLASCNSAVGGTYASQAQRLANALGKTVTGYYGTANPAGSWGTSMQFLPQTGFAAARTAVLNSAGSWFVKASIYGFKNAH